MIYIALGIVAAVAATLIWFAQEINQTRSKMSYLIETRGGPFPYDVHPKKVEEEYEVLSYARKHEIYNPEGRANPFRVMKLAYALGSRKTSFEYKLQLASSFYSQVKHWIRREKNLLMAISFWLESRSYSEQALNARNILPEEEKRPGQLEVIGAKDFMLAVSLPVVGPLFFKSSALARLQEAEEELQHKDETPIQKALIFSKLWKLTGNRQYSDQVQKSGLTLAMKEDDHARDDLVRISTHMGFGGSVDRLLEFCRAH